MKKDTHFTQEKLAYLKLLARQYPTVQSASTEIINLQAILNLPKGTEHFISDVHGEHEAFLHILNSASGVVREKLDELYGVTLSRAELDQLATLIYYPREKLDALAEEIVDMGEFYRITLHRLAELCRLVTSKYTRSKVRKALPKDYAYIIDELLSSRGEELDQRDYFKNIISTIIAIEQADDLIIALCEIIKRMAVDQLHIVGDIYDRGPHADTIMDSLLGYHNVDIQWGNHDILWMGAACGSRTLVATVLANSISYHNLTAIEMGYGISLRPLALFASEVYNGSNLSRFHIKVSATDVECSEKDRILFAQMHKAIAIILFKLEGRKIMRHPEYGMGDRLMLDKINYETQSITIDGIEYALEDTDFPTVDKNDPYALSPEEKFVIDQLTEAFQRSEKLQKHVRFLYTNGAIYQVTNGNLLFHRCVPMTADGGLQSFSIGCENLSGRDFLDFAETTARRAYYAKIDSPERQFGMDFLWFLWAGRNSPIFGRDRMTTFERRLIKDESAWVEDKNSYYTLYNDPAVCDRLLKEFGLEGDHCHIINGHMPVKSSKGESPLKGGGKLIVIDGGFCKAYQKTTGIAGYTLIYNSYNIRLVSHQPFVGREKAILENWDISSTSDVFERMDSRIKIQQTDIGKELAHQIDDLKALLKAYRRGLVTEQNTK